MNDVSELYVWKDGELILLSGANVSIFAHVIHYGTGAWGGVRLIWIKEGHYLGFRLKEHHERLKLSASVFGMVFPLDFDEFVAVINDLLQKNAELFAGSEEDLYLRPFMFIAGNSPFGMGVGPKWEVQGKLELKPTCACMGLWPWGKYTGGSAVEMDWTSIALPHPVSPMPGVKVTSNYGPFAAALNLNSSSATQLVLCGHDSSIREATGMNPFGDPGNGRHIVTPTNEDILPGITRATVIQLAQEKLGLEVIEARIDPALVPTFRGWAVTGTATGMQRVARIGEHRFEGLDDPGSPLNQLAALNDQARHGTLSGYEEWNTKFEVTA